jgi:BMFP domain-containing protein YqiC
MYSDANFSHNSIFGAIMMQMKSKYKKEELNTKSKNNILHMLNYMDFITREFQINKEGS